MLAHLVALVQYVRLLPVSFLPHGLMPQCLLSLLHLRHLARCLALLRVLTLGASKDGAVPMTPLLRLFLVVTLRPQLPLGRQLLSRMLCLLHSRAFTA